MKSTLTMITRTPAITIIITFVQVLSELFFASVLFFPLFLCSVYDQVPFVEYGIGAADEPTYVYPNAYLNDVVPDEECQQEDAQQRELALAKLGEAAEEQGQTDENTPPNTFRLSPRRIFSLSLHHYQSAAATPLAPTNTTASAIEDDKNTQLRVVILNVPAGIHLFHRHTELELDIYPFRSASPLRTAVQLEASRRSFPFRRHRRVLLQEVVNNITVDGLKYDRLRSTDGEDCMGMDGAADGDGIVLEEFKEVQKVWDVEDTWKKIMAEDASKGVKKRVEVYLVEQPSLKIEEAHDNSNTNPGVAGKEVETG